MNARRSLQCSGCAALLLAALAAIVPLTACEGEPHVRRPWSAHGAHASGAAHPTAVPSAPPVAFAPRKAVLEDKGEYPCSECHDESMAPDPRERALTEAHEDLVLAHGAGRLWCTSCHHDDRDQLKSAKGTPIDFDMPHELCGECHFEQQRDFLHGAHGKRVGNWNGARTATACTGCHDAHAPALKPRMPWRLHPGGASLSSFAAQADGGAHVGE